ncbi:MAG: hypothetical protein IKJ25_03075 [Clostridia bacterium]|nr:hypothetical protein [Clostridia bacterium]
MKNFFRFAIGIPLLIIAFVYFVLAFTQNILSPEALPFAIFNGLCIVAVGWGFLVSSTTEEMVRWGILGVASLIGQQVVAAFFPEYMTWFDKEMLENVLKAVFK